MDDHSTTPGILEEADEDILTYTVSDEEIEAAAGGGVLIPTQDSTACLRSILCC